MEEKERAGAAEPSECVFELIDPALPVKPQRKDFLRQKEGQC